MYGQTVYLMKCFLLLIVSTYSLGKGNRKNVLFIVVDDLRPALGCYGDVESITPNIDALADKSIKFTHAYAQQALCAPSRNSFLTSRRPDTLHLYDFYSYWRDVAGNFTTLPQYFKDNGYYTMSVGKVFHPGISSNWSDDNPYSWSTTAYHPPTQQYKNAPVCPGPDGQLHKNIVCPVDVSKQPGGSLPDIQSLKAAKTFLKQQQKNKKAGSGEPFFLAVGFHKPHVPLKYPAKFLNLFPLNNITLPSNRYHPPGMPLVAWNPWTDLRERDDIKSLNLSFPFGPMPDNYSKLIKQSYYAAVTYMDDLIGQLLHSLSYYGFFKDTIVLVVGDHGWSLGEHSEWSKFSNFEVAVKVPLLIHVPGVTSSITSSTFQHRKASNNQNYHQIAGLASDDLVELVDIFPTLVELADLPLLEQCTQNSSSTQLCTEGVSLAPLIQSKSSRKTGISHKWKTGAFSQYPRPSVYPTKKPNSDKPHLAQIKIMGYTLRTLSYRYTEWVPFSSKTLQPDWSTVIASELYDHNFDPKEDINLVGRPGLSTLESYLSKKLRAGWRHSLPTI